MHNIVLFGAFPRAKKMCSRSCFLVPSLVHKIVLFGAPPCAQFKIVLCGALPRARNRALYRAFPRAQNRAFRCFPSCKKIVLNIVLFGALLRAKKTCFLALSFVHCSPLSKHRALDRVFWCSPSCTNRCFCCCPSCEKLCFLVLSLVPKIVL